MSNIDSDLKSCIENNLDHALLEDIKEVLAVWEGANDGPDWHWVVTMKDGRFAVIQGGCDYTGWDCQSDAEIEYAETADAAAQLQVTSRDWRTRSQEIIDELLRQLREGKSILWTETMEQAEPPAKELSPNDLPWAEQ